MQALSAYARLQQLQIEPALLGAEDGTLFDAIVRTGAPDALIRELVQGPPAPAVPVAVQLLPSVQPAMPAPMILSSPVQPLPVARLVEPAPVVPTTPPRARRLNPPQQNAPRQGGGGCGGVLLVGMIAVGLAGYYFWNNGAVQGWANSAKARVEEMFAKNSGGPQGMDDLVRAKNGQSGDVQITLFWENKNDLDLHVFAPSGEEIYFGHSTSRCGGKLDVDMNAGGYANASTPAVENIHWPNGQAPAGNYRVVVHHFRNQGQPDTADPTRFRVRVLVRGVQVVLQDGEVVHADPQRQQVHVCDFQVP